MSFIVTASVSSSVSPDGNSGMTVLHLRLWRGHSVSLVSAVYVGLAMQHELRNQDCLNASCLESYTVLGADMDHCLSVRITPVAAIVSIFPFPLHKRKRPRSTFTSLLNLLPFYMFYHLSIHVLNCTVVLYHLVLFLSHAFFSKFKVARTLFFK